MMLEYGDLQLAFGTGKLFLTMNGFGTCCLVKDSRHCREKQSSTPLGNDERRLEGASC